MDYQTLVKLYDKWQRLASIATFARYQDFQSACQASQSAWRTYQAAVIELAGEYFESPAKALKMSKIPHVGG